MADSTIGITEPVSPNKLLDSESVTVGLNTVERERVQIAGDDATDIAPVTATDGLLVNLGTNNDVTVTGTVTATGPLTDTQLRATPVPVSLTSTTVTGTVAVTQSGTWDEVGINDSGNSITVDAVNLDIRDLTFAADKVDASGTVLGASTNNIGDIDILTIAAGDNNIGNVDIVTVPAPLSTTGGGTEATALRVTLANDSTGVVSIDDNGGAITVDGTVAVSSVGGTVAVTQSGTWDEVGINDSGNSITIDNATLAVVGGGTEATALRVTIANDSTGVVSVDDNGGSLTVDGAVFAGKSATATLSNVNSSATNVTLLASNASRNGVTIFNDSTKVLFVKLGATASATSFTAKLLAGAYYEVPFYYTGIIDGIWATANGAARMTELTT